MGREATLTTIADTTDPNTISLSSEVSSKNLWSSTNTTSVVPLTLVEHFGGLTDNMERSGHEVADDYGHAGADGPVGHQHAEGKGLETCL